MKSKLMPFFVMLLVITPIFFQNCSQSDDEAPKLSGYYVQDFSSIRYFLGGWYGPTDQKNWTYDVTIDLTTGDLTSKKSTYCFQHRRLNSSEISNLKKLIGQADVTVKKSGVTVMDAGAEMIYFMYPGTNQEKTIFLWPEAAAQGELYFNNPSNLRVLLQDFVYNTAGSQNLCKGLAQ